MATTKRNYPNDYFAWYNDDQRLAIVEKVTSSDGGSVHHDTYDTYSGTGDLSGNITATSTGSGATVTITSNGHGLNGGDRITISGTTSYDGNYAVVSATTNQFVISATNSESDEGASSGVTWTSLFINNGLRITYHSKYTDVNAQTDDLYTDAGLDSGMHQYILCYLKARLFEDMGDMQRASYYRQMYDMGIKQYPMRKSGIRVLSVPRL